MNYCHSFVHNACTQPMQNNSTTYTRGSTCGSLLTARYLVVCNARYLVVCNARYLVVCNAMGVRTCALHAETRFFPKHSSSSINRFPNNLKRSTSQWRCLLFLLEISSTRKNVMKSRQIDPGWNVEWDSSGCSGHLNGDTMWRHSTRAPERSIRSFSAKK